MRAVVVREFGTLENVAVTDWPDPAPGADDIVIEVRATAANYVDTLMVSGTYQSLPPLPFIPGKLPVGIVKCAGAAVSTCKPGDRAMALVEYGGFAEFVLTKAAFYVPLPPSISFTDAASMSSVFDTAWFALHERARLQSGETVLVLGATGGVGLAALQLAKAHGAKALAGITNPAKADLAMEAGADAIIDLAGLGLHDGLREQVQAVTGGHGADVALDMLGGDIFDAAIRALAWRGRLVVIGFAAGRIASLKTNYLLLKNIAVSGLQISNYRRWAPGETAACWTELFKLYEAGRIKPLPTAAWPIERGAEALAALRDRSVRGRIVLLAR
jgi:NADPH2:quinone reductase